MMREALASTPNGLGLAAPQIGELYCVIIVRKMAMINPEVVVESKKKVRRDEASLSYPGVVAHVERPHSIRVKYENEKRETKFRNMTGMTARICLHEIDHLSGNCYVGAQWRLEQGSKESKFPSIISGNSNGEAQDGQAKENYRAAIEGGAVGATESEKGDRHD